MVHHSKLRGRLSVVQVCLRSGAQLSPRLFAGPDALALWPRCAGLPKALLGPPSQKDGRQRQCGTSAALLPKEPSQTRVASSDGCDLPAGRKAAPVHDDSGSLPCGASDYREEFRPGAEP